MPYSPNKIRIAIIHGGPSLEHEVSLASAKNVISSLNSKNYQIKKVFIDKKGNWFSGFYRKTPKQILKNIDIAFNALHGKYGEDGEIQSVLSNIGIPYTGPDPIPASLSMDKITSRKLFAHCGLNTPKTLALNKQEINDFKATERKILHNFNLPIIVKPNSFGSSIGVILVSEKEQIIPAIRQTFKIDKIALIEEFIKGVELTCGVIETKSGINPLPPVMIISKSQLFNFKSKYDSKNCKEVCPAPLGEEINRNIMKTALIAHKALGLRHYSRTDMILAKDKLYVLETNSLPGLTKNSLLPKELAAWGMTMPQFVEHIIELAMH